MIAMWIITLILFVMYIVLACRKHNRYYVYHSPQQRISYEHTRKTILSAAVISALCVLVIGLMGK